MSKLYDERDGLPLPECNPSKKFHCPSCIVDMVYLGHGDFDEVLECWCQGAGELEFAPGFPEERP